MSRPAHRARSRAAATLAVWLVAAVTGGPLGVPARGPLGVPIAQAQEGPGAGAGAATGTATGSAPARIVLRGLAPTVGLGVGVEEVAWRVVVEHRGGVPGGPPAATSGANGPWERVDVVAELRGAVAGPAELAAALAGADVTPVLRQRTAALMPRALAPGELGLAEGAVPLRGLDPAGDPGGIHPLRLRMIADGQEVARLDTAVVRLERLPASPPPLAIVWPLTNPPRLAGDAATDAASSVADAAEAAALATATAPGGRLATIVAGLTAADPDLVASIGLAPAAHLIEDLAATAEDAGAAGAADAADLLAALRDLVAAGRAGPVATPYADVDLARLLAAAEGPTVDPATATTAGRLAAAAADEGGRRLVTVLGRAAAPVTLLDRAASPRALDLVERVVVVPAAAVGDDGADGSRAGSGGTAAVRRATAASGRIVTLVVADPALTAALAGTSGTAVAARQGGAVAAAQEVVVRAAALLLTGPEEAPPAAVLLPPSGLDPDPDALAEVLARLAVAPWLAPVTPAALAAQVDTATRPRAIPARSGSPAPARLLAALATADAALRTTTATVDTVALEGPLVIAGRTPRQLDDLLLRAAGAGTATDPSGDRTDRAVAVARAVGGLATGALGPVVVAVGDLTLTDGSGPLPLTVDGAGALPLRLTVELVGPAALAWPLGTRWDVALPVDADVALQVPVAARGTGVFPVTVLVRDAAGGVLAETTVAVRATEVAGPALLGIVVAVVVMTAVGLVRQRRRARRRGA